MFVVELVNVVNDHGRETPKYLISGFGNTYSVIEGIDNISRAAKYENEQVALMVAGDLLGNLACAWVVLSVEDSLARKLPGRFEIFEQIHGKQNDTANE